MLDLAINWQDPVTARWSNDFRVSSPVSAWMAGVLGLTSRGAFLAFHLVLAIAALLGAFVFPSVRGNPTRARFVLLVLAAGPIGAVLVTWVGSYDPVTVLAITFATLARKLWWQSAGWFVLAFNHNALAVVALGLSLLVVGLSRAKNLGPRSQSRSLVLLSAVIAGVLCNALVMSAWGATDSRIDFLQGIGLRTLAYVALIAAPFIAFSALGTAWLLLLDRRVRSKWDGKLMLGIAVLATCTIPLVALDESRTLGLALLAPMLLWTGIAATYSQEDTDGLWRTWRLPALVVPVFLVMNQGFVAPGYTVLVNLPPTQSLLQLIPG